MSELLCIIVAFVLGWASCTIIGRTVKKDGSLYVETNGDTPNIYMELNIDISELRKSDTVELEVKKIPLRDSQ